MGVDISKAICEAIDIIVNQKLANADFMRTVQGKIVSTQRPNGSYKVTYSGGPGVIQAQPLNDNIIYNQNQAVMLLLGNDNTVVILNKINTGNNNVIFDSQKYNIVGEQIVYNANNISICNLSSYINDSLMFIDSGKSEATTVDETIQRYMKQETTNGVVLSAYFTTRLAASQINGNYGLKFTFQFKKKGSNNLYTKTYTLDVRNITGANPYTLNNAIKVSRVIEDFPYEDFQYIKQIEGFTQNFPHDNNLNEVKDILIADPSISSAYILTEQDKKDFHLFLQAQKGTYLNSTNYTYLPIKAVLKKDGNNIVTNENKDVVTDVTYRWYVKDTSIDSSDNQNSYQDNYGGPGWKLIFRLDDDTKRVTSRTLKVTNQAYQVISEEDRKRSLIVSGKITTIKCIAFYNQIVKQNQIIINYNDGVILSITNNKNNISNTFYNTGDVIFTCNVKDKNENVISNNKYIWEITAPDWQTYKTTINGTPNLTYNRIGEFSQGTITCTVYHSDNNDGVYNTFYGTVSSPIYYKPALGIYYINIQGGNRLIQYNEDGTLVAGGEGLAFDPLTFELIAPQGAPVTKDSSADTSPKILSWLWEVPAQNSLFVTNAQPILNITSTGIDPSATSNTSGNYNYYIGDTTTGALPFSFNNYTKNAINNTIRLYILFKEGDKQQLISETTSFTPLRMGDPGTNGTNTYARLIPYNTIGAIDTTRIYAYKVNNSTVKFYSDNSLSLTSSEDFYFYYDIIHDNAPAYIGTESNIKWELPINKIVNIEENNNKSLTSLFNGQQLEGRVSHVIKNENFALPTTLEGFNKYTSNIVRAVFTNNVGTKYYAEYPICYVYTVNNTDRIRIKKGTGYTYIVYDEAGRLPRYNGTNNFTVQLYRNNTLVTTGLNYQWSIFNNPWTGSATGFTLENETTQTLTCKPSISSNGNDLTRAILCTITENNQMVGFIHIPILVSLNRYNHKYLNDWDGHSIQLDANNNTAILAPEIGAGSKNTSDNTFTGVLMGQIQTRNNGTATSETGLFGYDKGQRSFFLDAQTGTAVFGKVSNGEGGQIVINPSYKIRQAKNANQGDTTIRPAALLYSNNYTLPNTQTVGNQKVITLNVSEHNTEGMIIDLSTPQIGYGNGNFYVTKDGLLHATGATISGNISIDTTSSGYDSLKNQLNQDLDIPDVQGLAVKTANYSTTGENEDNQIIRGYAGIGSKKMPNCDVNYDFGSSYTSVILPGTNPTTSDRTADREANNVRYFRLWAGTGSGTAQQSFGVDHEGILYAKGAYIQGSIQASSKIGDNNTVTSSGNISATRVGMGRTASAIDVSEFPGISGNKYLNLWGKSDSSTLSGSNLVFGITENGEVLAKSAHLTGTINATGGNIGGWEIKPGSNGKLTYLNHQTETRHIYLNPDGTGTRAIAIGKKENNDWVYPFYVAPDGTLHATGAEISGNIKAGSAIGDLDVKKDTGASVASFAGIGTISLTNTNLKNSFGYETSTTPWVGILWGGTTANDYDKLQFLVTRKGVLFAKSAHITGEITAESGRIGGVHIEKIDNNAIYTGTGSRSFTNENIQKSFGYTISNKTAVGVFWAGENSYSSSTYADNLRFLVTHNGSLFAKSGNIGGWNIHKGYLHNTNGSNYFEMNTSSSEGKTGYYLWAGTTSGTRKFGVTKAGKLYATGADITGDITATKLTITDNATISGLKVTNAMIGSLKADKISGGTLDFNNITVKNLTVTNGMISSLNGTKITAGTLDVSKLNGSNPAWRSQRVISALSFNSSTRRLTYWYYSYKFLTESGYTQSDSDYVSIPS